MITSTVYVVDDDVSVRESLELLIGHAGWRAETFASARDFLEYIAHARAREPGCLVLDVRLPDLNGLELQQRRAVFLREDLHELAAAVGPVIEQLARTGAAGVLEVAFDQGREKLVAHKGSIEPDNGVAEDRREGHGRRVWRYG